MICHYRGWLLLPAFLIFSCTSPGQFHYYEYDIEEPAITNYVARTDKTRLEKIEFISRWIFGHIEYTQDKNNEWQTPPETYALRTGDCEDVGILFMFFVNKHFGYEPILIGVRNNDGTEHIVIEIEDIFYFNTIEKMIGGPDPSKWSVYLEIGYYYALYMAGNER